MTAPSDASHSDVSAPGAASIRGAASTPVQPPTPAALRVGLVLGGGGMTGTAYHAGVIAGLEEFTGWDPRSAEVVVGTSAGSTSSVLLRAGLPPADFLARMLGTSLSADGSRVLAGLGPLRAPTQRAPRTLRPSSTALLAAVARRPWRFQVEHVATALVPPGTRAVMDTAAGVGAIFAAWPSKPTWICAVHLDTGRRVVFGRDAHAPVADAVSASCAIPGYFAPVVIDGERYVDGGVASMHSADLLVDSGLDVVVISAPLATTTMRAIEAGNALRVPVRFRLDREVARLRRSGTEVIVIAPDRRIRAVLGGSTMDVQRRGPVVMGTFQYVRQLAEQGDLAPLA